VKFAVDEHNLRALADSLQSKVQITFSYFVKRPGMMRLLQGCNRYIEYNISGKGVVGTKGILLAAHKHRGYRVKLNILVPDVGI
jgi:hypothetical protein